MASEFEKGMEQDSIQGRHSTAYKLQNVDFTAASAAT